MVLYTFLTLQPNSIVILLEHRGVDQDPFREYDHLPFHLDQALAVHQQVQSVPGLQQRQAMVALPDQGVLALPISCPVLRNKLDLERGEISPEVVPLHLHLDLQRLQQGLVLPPIE